MFKPPVGRSDGGGLPPAGAQQSLPFLAAERASAPGRPCSALSESCCGDNTPNTFSRFFADALLPAQLHDSGTHAGWIRSASPRRPAAMGSPEQRGLLSCSCLEFVGGTHTHRSYPCLATGNVAPDPRE